MKPDGTYPSLDDIDRNPPAPRLDVEPCPRGGELRAAMLRTAALPRMTTVREVFRQQRLAHRHHRAWQFYMEHNLFEQARDSRGLMLLHLRTACQQWRLTLRGGLEDGSPWRQEAGGQGPADPRSDGTALG